MELVTITLIAVGLAMDAFAVSIASGVAIKDMKINYALRIALFFGLFQAFMPLVGWLAGLNLKNFVEICTVTTRPKRKGEKEGRDYYFVSKDEFEKMIKRGEVVEYNFYNGHYYGTPKKDLETALKKGKNVLLEIDVNGAKNIKKLYPKNSILIFITAPLKDIERRLKKRGKNTPTEIKERLTRAKKEQKEKKNYDFVILNEEGKPEEAGRELAKILNQI